MLSAIIAISTLILLVGSSLANNNNNNQQQQQQLPGYNLPRPDTNGRPQLLVAIYCAGSTANSARSSNISLYHNQYLDIKSKKWRSDREASAFCTQDKQQILNYCRKVYPDHDVRNIVESSRQYKIDNWCKIGSSKARCRTRLTVKPYRCLEGTFQSDALLVPERCLFDHVHNKSVCENSDLWNKTATDNCHSKDMKLQSFAMLQPCGLGVFSGVEFVCCPPASHQADNTKSPIKDGAKDQTASRSEGNSFAQAANGILSKYEQDDKFNSIKIDAEVVRKHHDQSDKDDDQEESDADEDDEDEYDDDEDEYDDDSTSWNGDKASSTTTSTTTTTTTTTTERPIDHYLSHFDLAHERDEFRRAELAVEGNYRDKITHVMREWSQLDSHYEEMKKRNPQAAEDFKKRMTHHFQKTIEALEEEGAAQRHQLASMHAERAMAIINRRKKAAMDCLTQALDRMPIRTRQVERCIVKLLKALEKDRTHTLRQYKNLLNINTREALREKKIILDHLVTLNRAANQSIAMLDRSPVLVDKLKSKIVALWHKLRNIPADEPIVRESELKIMEKYEEEVAQLKIERERQRLIDQEAVQDIPQESSSGSKQQTVKEPSKETVTQQSDDDSNSNNVKSILPSPEAKGPAPQQTTVTTSSKQPESNIELTTPNTPVKPQHLIVQTSDGPMSSRSSVVQGGGHTDMDNEIHYQSIDSAKFAHLKVDSSHHELSYSVKHEPIESRLKFGYSTFLVSACTIVIALALIGMRYYSKHSTRAYRRQGFAEVGRTCPEEKNVTSMQFNGYENPAYKFFEAEA